MIKTIIRKTCLPIQIIFDAIHHQRKQRLMMSYTLKINPKQNYCALRNEVIMKNVQAKHFNLARTVIDGA